MQLPNGLQMAIAATFGTSFTVSAISNATEAVATLSASHGVAANDIIVLSSGWNGADKKVQRAKTVSTNDVTLEGFDTTKTTSYPPGIRPPATSSKCPHLTTSSDQAGSTQNANTIQPLLIIAN